MVEQAIWAIGNIACDSPHHRDNIIKHNGINNILTIIDLATSQLQTNKKMIDIIKSAAWSLSNFCRVKPLPEYEIVEKALDKLVELVKANVIDDKSTLLNILWALSNYSTRAEGKKKNSKIQVIQKCIDRGIVPYVVEIIRIQDE